MDENQSKLFVILKLCGDFIQLFDMYRLDGNRLKRREKDSI